MISRYIHDPSRGHWKAVKWILQYIKGIMMLVWYSRRILQVSRSRRSISNTLIPTTLKTLTNASIQRDMCLHYPKHWSAGALLYSLLSHCLLWRSSIWPWQRLWMRQVGFKVCSMMWGLIRIDWRSNVIAWVLSITSCKYEAHWRQVSLYLGDS